MTYEADGAPLPGSPLQEQGVNAPLMHSPCPPASEAPLQHDPGVVQRDSSPCVTLSEPHYHHLELRRATSSQSALQVPSRWDSSNLNPPLARAWEEGHSERGDERGETWTSSERGASNSFDSPRKRRVVLSDTSDTPQQPSRDSISSNWRASLTSPVGRLRRLVSQEDVAWYWKHRTGWKPYSEQSTRKIEAAFQSGESKVRLKTGKSNSTPMEIFFEDMLQHDPITRNCRDVKREGPDDCFRKARRWLRGCVRWLQTGRPRRELFHDYQQRRKRLREEMDQKEYDVTKFYKDSGCCAAIARSSWFFALVMCGVVLNSIWIAYDANYNEADTLSSSAIGFKLAEYGFCFFFLGELLIRFGAFSEKRHCLQDAWFVFDLLLAIFMIIEMWLVPLVLALFAAEDSEEATALNQLDALRMVRLLRLSRVTRLLRLAPEMLTLLKGISTALSGVLTTFALLMIMVFVFGIVFKTATENAEEVNEQYFQGVVFSMTSLLFHGTLLDSPSRLFWELYQQVGMFAAGLFLAFIFLSSFTLLNMLIGILCEVVSQVSQTEKEESEVNFLKNNLLGILECYDTNNDNTIGTEEFDLLMENIELRDALRRFGTDITGIISLKDVLFEGGISGMELTRRGTKAKRARKELSFKELMNVFLRLRGGHSAKVTDFVELREYLRQKFDRLENSLGVARGQSMCSLPEVCARRSLNKDGDREPFKDSLKDPLKEAFREAFREVSGQEGSEDPPPLKAAIIGARCLSTIEGHEGVSRSSIYCTCSVPEKPHTMTTQTLVRSGTLNPVWNHEFEFADFCGGDSLRFEVLDRGASRRAGDDSLGYVTLASSFFYPQGFDGEVQLRAAGANVQAYLRVAIRPTGQPAPTVEQLLHTTLARVNEVCEGQQQLRTEVCELREQVRSVQQAWADSSQLTASTTDS